MDQFSPAHPGLIWAALKLWAEAPTDDPLGRAWIDVAGDRALWLHYDAVDSAPMSDDQCLVAAGFALHLLSPTAFADAKLKQAFSVNPGCFASLVLASPALADRFVQLRTRGCQGRGRITATFAYARHTAGMADELFYCKPQ